MKETINDRLEILIKALGFSSLNAFDKVLEVPRNTTVCYVGEQRSRPGSGYLEKIALRFSNVDTRWLLAGEGEIFFPEKMKKEYVESLEQKIEALERANRRYETMIDMAAQSRAINFQPLSEETHVREIYPLYSSGMLKKTA